MDPTDVLDGCVVEVAPDVYAVITTAGDHDDHDDLETFATIDDGRERTHVVREERLDEIEPLDVERGWTPLTFDAVLPFDLVGFLAVVASALAERGVSIFALSAYSTDHVLVKQEGLEVALATLTDLGCEVKRR